MSDEPGLPPFTVEDSAYQAIVSEYAGLVRAGADPFSAALITAAHLVIMAAAGTAGQQSG
jgi:hypothetical protein